MASRTQGSKPRPKPRTQRMSEDKAKNSPFDDRPSRGQGQECSRPRTKNTGASVLQKKSLQKNVFQAISKKKGIQKFFSGDLQNFNNSKNTAVLEPRTGQYFEELRLRGQGQGRELRGQGHQNVSSRPKTSLRTPSLIYTHLLFFK